MHSFLILSLLLSPYLYGAKKPPNCSQLENKIGRPPAAGLWGSETPLYVTGKKGRQLPITFSHDSEIPNAETYRFVRAHPEKFKKIQEVMDRFSISVPELMRKFEMTEAQIRSFVVRKGVNQRETKNSFKASELNPRYLSEFDFFAFDGLHIDRWAELLSMTEEQVRTLVVKKSRREEFYLGASDIKPEYLARIRPFALLPFRDLEAAILALLRKKGYSVDAHRDGGLVELTHSSSEQVPAHFRTEIDGLHREIRGLQTHLHLGIPTAVPIKNALAIARALETKIILKMLAIAPTDLRRPRFSGSTLSRLDFLDHRGFIKLTENEFKKPVPAHNLEIRQYNSLEEGFDLLRLATELAADHAQLRIPKNYKPKKVTDEPTANLNGALWYAGLILEQRCPSRKPA